MLDSDFSETNRGGWITIVLALNVDPFDSAWGRERVRGRGGGYNIGVIGLRGRGGGRGKK